MAEGDDQKIADYKLAMRLLTGYELDERGKPCMGP
jgi:hypothetical protein